MEIHITKTVERVNQYPTILAIQDTSYIFYKNHKKTEGLGVISARLRSKTPPTLREAVKWIAQLGGFLARKNDGQPGPITLWREV